MGPMKTAKLLAAIVDQRLAGLDVQNPQVTCAVDRLRDGHKCGLSDLLRLYGSIPLALVDLVLVAWQTEDCSLVFGYSRDDILDMIN